MTVSACRHPIQLRATTATNKATGKSEQADKTATVPCGNRRETVCADCSETYRKRTHVVIASGLRDAGDQVHVFLLTLTAPSFGPVHTPGWKKGKKKPRRPRKCHCHGSPVHNPERDGNAVIGSPLDTSRYQYREAVDWNENVSRIWARFMQDLRRTVQAAAPGLDVQVCRVAEPQRRGQVHFHALLVFRPGKSSVMPEPDNLAALIALNLPTPPADANRLKAAGKHHQISAGSAIAAARSAEPDEPANYWNSPRSFGNRWDLMPVTPRPGRNGEPAHRGGMAAYLSKYLTKASAGQTENDRVPEKSPIAAHLSRLGDVALASASHRHLLRASRIAALGAEEAGEVRKRSRPGDLKRAREGFGYSGPPRTSTRGYGVTMKSLKEAARVRRRTLLGLPAELTHLFDWQYDSEGTKRLRNGTPAPPQPRAQTPAPAAPATAADALDRIRPGAGRNIFAAEQARIRYTELQARVRPADSAVFLAAIATV